MEGAIEASRGLIWPPPDQRIALEEVGGPQLEAAGQQRHHRKVFLARQVMDPHRVP